MKKKASILIEVLIIISLSSFFILKLIEMKTGYENRISLLKEQNNLYTYYYLIKQSIHEKKEKHIKHKNILDYIQKEYINDSNRLFLNDIYFDYDLIKVKDIYVNNIHIFLYIEKVGVNNIYIKIPRYLID